MEKLTIQGTDSTPRVSFDHLKGSFELSGRSFSENVAEFYHPLILWVEKYIEIPLEETHLSINLDLINDSSMKYLVSLFNLLEGLKKKGKSISVTWWFMEDDEETKEIGESFLSLTNLKINIQALPAD